MPDPDMNGFLPSGNRELLSEGVSSADANPTKWYRLRERVKWAFDDFVRVQKHLPAKQRDLIFDQARSISATGEERIEQTQEQWGLYDGMIAVLAFLYEVHETQNWDFDDFLWAAIEEVHMGNPRDLPEKTLDRDRSNFDPELTEPESPRRALERARRKRDRGEPLTDREILATVEYNDWPSDQNPQEFVREQRRDRALHDEFENWAAKRPWTAEEDGEEGE